MTALSIIIPTYNRLWALPKAIESIRATKNLHEIIVVDDGSTDGTSDWLAQQSDIVAVRTENWGKDWAVNRGFAMARGTYVRFLDSDDWLETDANDAQLEIALNEQADIVTAGYRTYDDRTDAWVEAPWVHCDDFIAQQLGEVQSGHYSAFLFRREFIADLPHRPEFLANDDRMFILEAALRHPRVASWDRFALIHRHHGRGRLQAPTSSEVVPVLLAELKIYRKVYRVLAARGELTARRGRAAPSARLRSLAFEIARYDLDEAVRVFDWMRELDPAFVMPGSGLVPTLCRSLGFRRTAQLLRLRRRLLAPFRAWRRAQAGA